jgi:hypothetical protein
MDALDRKNAELCAAVAKLAVEHAEMAAFIKAALPFLKNAPADCSVYEDAQHILKSVAALDQRITHPRRLPGCSPFRSHHFE